MKFKEETIEDIVTSEKEMFLKGAENYGNFFINASAFNHLLQEFIKSIDDSNKFISVVFIFQLRKHHTLAFLSAIRRHHIQANINLRYVIEAGQWASYAMCFSETGKFFKKPEKEMYKWLDDNFKEKANKTKILKKIISNATCHSDVLSAFQNFQINPENKYEFNTTYFDKRDDHSVKTDLWFVANTALGLLDLFYNVNKQYKVFQFTDDFEDEFKKLAQQNNKLKNILMNTEGFKEAQDL